MSEQGGKSSIDSVETAPLGRAARVLIIDDEWDTLEILRDVLQGMGYQVSAYVDAASAMAFFKAHAGWADIVLSDLRMPETDGLSLLQEFRRIDTSIAGILLTGFGNLENAVEAMRAGAIDFITKPFDFAVLEMALERAVQHRAVLLDNQRYQADMARLVQERGAALEEAIKHLEMSYQFMLESLVSMLEAREKATGEHTKRVTEISVLLAGALGIEGAQLETIRRGAFLHDIGKVAIPDAILLKPGPLDSDEWEIMKTHVSVGYEILKSNPYIHEVAELVYSHHEHYDGHGYPRGLKGEEICLGARVFAVADAYDAIRSTRPYSQSQSASTTLAEIVRWSGRQFDPAVVEALKSHHAEVEAIWLQGASKQDRLSNTGNNGTGGQSA